MPDFIDRNGNWNYVRSGYTLSNTHGVGNSELHLREFEEITNRIVDDKLNQIIRTLEPLITNAVEQYGKQVWERLIGSLDSVIKTDIETQVNIGFRSAKDIFNSKECKEYISDIIYKQLKSELSKIKGIKIK